MVDEAIKMQGGNPSMIVVTNKTKTNGSCINLYNSIFLLSTGKAVEIRKNKSKTRKYLMLIAAVLIVTVISMFVLLGVNF